MPRPQGGGFLKTMILFSLIAVISYIIYKTNIKKLKKSSKKKIDKKKEYDFSLLDWNEVDEGDDIDHDKYEYEYEYIENEDGELVEVPVRKKLKELEEDVEESDDETETDLDETVLDDQTLGAEFDVPDAIADPDDIDEEDKAAMVGELITGLLKDIIIEETIEAAIWKSSKFLKGKLRGAALKQIQKEAAEKAGRKLGQQTAKKKMGKNFVKKTKNEMIEAGTKASKKNANKMLKGLGKESGDKGAKKW